LRKALTPSRKPLLVNFWATWCDPCREEFPDLVKLDAEYKGKIDFITISLDELSEIDRDVPSFSLT
jgi:thiol-disulfide isomerase/thioredoxin